MLRLLILAALGAATPALAQEQASGDSEKPIVVTGHRISELKDELAACIARKCRPDYDIAATIKLAEEQFVQGNYADANTTLRQSLRRNHGYGKDYPVSLSYLYRASYRIAEHLGNADDYQHGVFGTLRSLKEGLPENDMRVLGAELEVGDMLVRLYRYDEAVNRYKDVEKIATGRGYVAVEALAQFKVVGLYSQLATISPRGDKAQAKEAAEKLINNPDPRIKPFADAARITLAILDAKTGNPGAIDKLIAQFRTDKSVMAPILLYVPPFDYVEGDGRSAVDHGSADGIVSGIELVGRQNYDGEWVDVDFWITPDGHVSGVDVARTGKGKGTPSWVAPILKSIGGRRYAPLNVDPSSPGIFRVERYTLTARVSDPNIGSHIRSRELTPQIEMLDLSVDPAATPDGNHGASARQ